MGHTTDILAGDRPPLFCPADQYRATLSPMSAALRPHRGGTVLALGILSVLAPVAFFALSQISSTIGDLFFPFGLVFVPLGLVTWIQGMKQVTGMKARRVDPSGRNEARIGRVLGVVGVAEWLAIAGLFIYAQP
jgi:hypothetical protein